MNLKKLLIALTALPLLAMAQVDDTSKKYDVDSLPNDHYGRLARYGKYLSEKTFEVIGPEVANKKMRYAGNNLACTNCHQESATKKFAMPWVGAQATFPQYRGREDDVSTIEERVNGCMERSMNGKPLPFDSKEMKAYATYIHFLSKGVPVGTSVEGQGLPKFAAPDRASDIVAGEKVYAEKCVACHAADGSGLRNGKPGEAKGYTFPPLWGKDTFNNGAGMNRLLTAASFIKTNMPLGAAHGQAQLSNDEAYDVAGYIVSKPRSIKPGLDKDFPARWNKPVDAAFPPYVDGASAEQHKYGPFKPLAENMKRLKLVLDKGN
jgi:thiosulfate dehydrogenase